MERRGITHTAYLLLGGNLGDRAFYVNSAVASLATLGHITAASSLMETEPWGFTEPVPFFLNQVICLETILEPECLLLECQAIEKKLGRKRNQTPGPRTYQSRTIDIDILLYDRLHYTSSTLQIPHPRIQERPFSVALLEEVLPKTLSLNDFLTIEHDTRRTL